MSAGAPPQGPQATARPGVALGCLLVLLIWAGIYLPALGLLPLEHEEPRRALPALHMLSSGDWLVPRVGSEPYLRKPPLLNWLIALSFAVTGNRTEAAARLPSVLATVAMALAIVIVAGRSWLACAAQGRLAAVFFLTNLAMMETGRLAELEALYIALTGIALVLWLAGWHRQANPWRLWLMPARATGRTFSPRQLPCLHPAEREKLLALDRPAAVALEQKTAAFRAGAFS